MARLSLMDCAFFKLGRMSSTATHISSVFRHIAMEERTSVSHRNYIGKSINPKNAFIGDGLFFENRQEARKPGLLQPGKSFEAVW